MLPFRKLICFEHLTTSNNSTVWSLCESDFVIPNGFCLGLMYIISNICRMSYFIDDIQFYNLLTVLYIKFNKNIFKNTNDKNLTNIDCDFKSRKWFNSHKTWIILGSLPHLVNFVKVVKWLTKWLANGR